MENLKLLNPLNIKLKYERTIAVSFSVTHKCNLKCIHCPYSAADLIDRSEEMDTVQTISTLDNIIKCEGVVMSQQLRLFMNYSYKEWNEYLFIWCLLRTIYV